jgi:hypothetical protein
VPQWRWPAKGTVDAVTDPIDDALICPLTLGEHVEHRLNSKI